ncbi:hypothetical protein LZ30DRAFT_433126 [Colletotrichum cereale]|nr:hypothetical protein LZ30DRAFT_433126 [Colletotrichum cereale]
MIEPVSPVSSQSSQSSPSPNAFKRNIRLCLQQPSPAQPTTPRTALPSDPADLHAQIPPTPDHPVAAAPTASASASASAPSPPPAPAPSRFHDADSLPFPSPWPASPTTRANVGAQNNGWRCLHQDVYPCFCRGHTEHQGYVCRPCRFEKCPVNAMIQTGSAGVIRRALEAEIARRRRCWLFEGELRWALENARERERDAR